MKLVAKFTSEHLGLTEGKQYDMLFEYDTVYEVKVDDGKIYCRNKDFFDVVDKREAKQC